MAEDAPTIAERVKIFRKSCAGCSTQQAFAAALDIDQQRLSGYENGTRVPHHVVANMVRMGANPYWLLFGEGEMRGGPNATENVRDMAIKAISLTSAEVDDRQLAEFYILPLYSDEVAAGVPREVRDTEIEGPAIIHRAWCPHPRETDYVRVHSSGNSMEPTIPAGAIVTIDRAENEPERLVGKAVAISLREGGVTLKRLQRTARGGFVGVPDNPTHENRAIHLDDGDRIIGLVQTVHARIG
jgi:phage repressor protein C with HTH and peptisase S24 domain